MSQLVTDAVTFTTAAGNKTVAITPAVGELLIVVAANTGTTTDPTVTDDRGGTYTMITAASCVKNASADEMHFYVRDTPCQLALAHTITMNVGGAGTGGGAWAARISGMAKYGANAVRQATKQDNQAAAGTPTGTFALPILAESLCVFAVFNATNPAGITPPTDFTEQEDVGYATPTTGLEVATRDNGQTGLTITAGGTSASAFCMLAVEIDTATPTAGGGGRSQTPGQPHEWARRRLPFPARGEVLAGTLFTITPTGAVTPAGTLVFQTNKSATAAITPTGALAKSIQKPYAGSVIPAGALAKLVDKLLSGGITPTGALTTVRVILRDFAGSITPTGALIKQTSKPFVGSVTPAGALAKLVSKPLAGALIPAGALVKLVSKAFAGSLTPSGTLANVKVVLRTFAGAIIPTGTLTRTTGKALTGSVASAGTITKAVSKTLAGTIAPSGALTKLAAKLFVGVVAMAGTLATQLVGAIEFATSRFDQASPDRGFNQASPDIGFDPQSPDRSFDSQSP